MKFIALVLATLAGQGSAIVVARGGHVLATIAGQRRAIVVARGGWAGDDDDSSDAWRAQRREAVGTPSAIRSETHVKPQSADSPDTLEGARGPEAWDPEQGKEEFAYAACLMGGVAVVMALFYLVNSPREEIRTSTWQALNMTISIFCAVLIFGLVKEVAAQLMGRVKGEGIPQFLSVWIFVIVFILFQATLCLCAYLGQGYGIVAMGTLFAHMAGFASMFMWADIQFLEPFRHSVWMTTLVACASGFTMCLLNWSSHHIRDKVVSWDGKVDEEEEAWQNAVDDAEQDVLSLTMGFTLMQSLRFAIVGEAQAFEPTEAPEDIVQWEADALLICCVAFAVLVAGSASVNARVLERLPKHSLPWLLQVALPSIMSMGMSWSLLFWGEWQIYCLGFKGVRIAGCLCVALLMTLVAILCVFGLEFFASLHRQSQGEKLAVRELVLALGLLVGFTWERSFDMGLEVISELHGSYAWITTHLLSIALLAVVLPAWSKYVLPKAATN